MFRDKRPSYGRQRYRQERREFLRRNRAALLVVAAAYVAIDAVLWAGLDGYLLGVAQAGAASLIVLALFSIFHANTGAIWRIAGAWGEDNTNDTLKSAKRHRLIWGWVSGIETQSGDIDHLVVLRNGDVIAIDSKWHVEVRDRRTLQRDAYAASAAARRASLILRSLKQNQAVRPIVVIWGGAQQSVPDDAVVEGVLFLAGGELMDWLRSQGSLGVRRKRAREVLADLESFKRRVRPPAAVPN